MNKRERQGLKKQLQFHEEKLRQDLHYKNHYVHYGYASCLKDILAEG